MSAGTQLNRSMAVATPLPFDALLLLGFTGEEGISRLFRFRLDLAAPDASAVSFEKLLGRPVSVRLALRGGAARYFSGICSRLSQGTRTTESTAFSMEVVPAAWLLTRRARSKIFQGATVPDILREVFAGIPDVSFNLRGHYPPRDFCVQYRETDFNFVSRLMEEEGISYYFRHTADGHTMVIGDADEYPPLRPDALVLQPVDEGPAAEDRITHWEKTQELSSTKFTLRDHTFEIPHEPLQADARVPESVTIGRVDHKLRLGKSDALEVYDWPGEYAQRFDGVDRGGNDRPGDLEEVYRENRRTALIRAGQGAAAAINVRGAGRYRHLCSGHTFSLTEVFAEPYVGEPVHDGRYVLTSVSHVGRVGESYRSGGESEDLYHNSFTCLPVGLPFRPQRTTPRPVIQGTQTAIVVGPVGEEIHTDKYGRVRVKFHWDREAKGDDSSSCWIRVAQIAGGGVFAGVHIPRVGQEVVVQFEEGDPDRPIIVGSVYNPTHMPPFGLPESKMISGLKSNSYPGGGGYNEIIVNDTKGNELIRVHGQYDMDSTVEHDLREHVLNDRSRDVTNNETIQIGVDQSETVGNNQTLSVGNNRTKTVGVNESETIGANKTIAVGANHNETIAANATVSVGGSQATTVGGSSTSTVGMFSAETVGAAKALSIGAAYQVSVGGLMNETVAGAKTEEIGSYRAETVGGHKKVIIGGDLDHNVTGKHVEKAAEITLMAATRITLMCGASSIILDAGTVTIKAPLVKINC